MSTTSTTEVLGKRRRIGFGEQIGSIEVNTLATSDISGVRTINLLPYPPTTAGGNLPVGTLSDATLRWNGSAWVENTGVTATSGGNVTLSQINTIPFPFTSSDNGSFSSASMFPSAGAGVTFGSASAAATFTRKAATDTGLVRASINTTADVLIGGDNVLVSFTINGSSAMVNVATSWTTCYGTFTMFANDTDVPSASGVISIASGTTAQGFAMLRYFGSPPVTVNFVVVMHLTASVP